LSAFSNTHIAVGVGVSQHTEQDFSETVILTLRKIEDFLQTETRVRSKGGVTEPLPMRSYPVLEHRKEWFAKYQQRDG